jgi:hypothetical protein
MSMDRVEMLRSALEDVAREREAAAAELERLDASATALRVVLALETGEDAPRSLVPPGRVLPERQDRTRTRAVEAVLRAAPGPLTRGQVAEALLAGGRDVTADDVSASLTYLRRAGRVRNTAEGWRVS